MSAVFEVERTPLSNDKGINLTGTIEAQSPFSKIVNP